MYAVPLVATAEPTVMWVQRFENLREMAVGHASATHDGGIAVCGSLPASTPGSNTDGFLYKFDGRGRVLWYQQYGDTGSEAINFVETTPDGGFVTFGSASGSVWVQKLDASGIVQWQHRGAGMGFPLGTICQTSDGGYVYSTTFRDDYHVRIELALVKLNAAGSVVWTRLYPLEQRPSRFEPGDVIETRDSGILATGTMLVPTGTTASRMVIIRTDATGTVVWSRELGDSLVERSGGGIREILPGQYVIQGRYTRPDSRPERYLVRLNDSGDTLWTAISPVLGSTIYCQTDTDSSLLGVVSVREIDFNHGVLSIVTYLFRADLNGQLRWSTLVARQYGEWWVHNGFAFACDSSFIVPLRVGLTGGAIAMLTPEGEPHDCGRLPLVPSSTMDLIYPNPFNSTANIRVWLPKPAVATVKVFDVLGREVATIHDGAIPQGETTLRYSPGSLASGAYFCRFEALGKIEIQRMIFLR